MRLIERMRRYIMSVRAEVARVSWPSRREVVSLTVLIIILTVALGLYLTVVDVVLQQIIRVILAR